VVGTIGQDEDRLNPAEDEPKDLVRRLAQATRCDPRQDFRREQVEDHQQALEA